MTTRYITEAKWKVTLQTGAPTMQTFEKVLDAPSQGVAIYRAQQEYPNVQFVQVSAVQMDAQGAGPTANQGTNTPTGTGQLPGFKPLQPLQPLNPGWPKNAAQPQQESTLPVNPQSVSYPYSISLPQQFAEILRESAPVAIHNHDGRYSIVLETEQDMRGFLNRLIHHGNRDAVRAIIAGIRSSIG
jgi:hypothetical protein